MTKKTGPYVGVTGFMSREEVEEALSIVPDDLTHRLMVGVLMSSKTIVGREDRWPGQCPRREAVSGIFIDDPRALNLIHYSTDFPNTLSSQLEDVMHWAGPQCDGVQLNSPWPRIDELAVYRRKYRDAYVVLQIGALAMSQLISSDGGAGMFAMYRPYIDAILIDPSGGTGKSFDPEEGAKYLEAAKRRASFGLGIAGGLGPDTLGLLDPLLPRFPVLSIDAQGKLRTVPPEDALSVPIMKEYVTKAFALLAGTSR